MTMYRTRDPLHSGYLDKKKSDKKGNLVWVLIKAGVNNPSASWVRNRNQLCFIEEISECPKGEVRHQRRCTQRKE